MSILAPINEATRDAILAGDPAATAQISGIARARVARVLGRGADVDDVVQSVLEKLFADDARALRSWRPDGGASLAGWVALIAERQALSHLRSRRRAGRHEQITGDAVLECVAAHCDEGRLVARDQARRVIGILEKRLTPLGTRMLRELFLEERDAAEIETDLGMSPEAVWAWRSRIRRAAGEAARELAA